MKIKKNIIKVLIVSGIFIIIYLMYFKYYYDDDVNSTITSTYYLIVGNNIGVGFIIPMYIYILINETKYIFNLNVLVRFSSYDKWFNRVFKYTSISTLRFVGILNIAYVLSVIMTGAYSIDIYSLIPILQIGIIQVLVLTLIGVFIQLMSFLWENRYISFCISYGIILGQYSIIRLLRIPKSSTIVDMIFFDPTVFSSGFLIKKMVVSIMLIGCFYYIINLIIIKKDILWSNSK